VKCTDIKIKPLLDSFLGNVYMVKDMDRAFEINHPHVTFITSKFQILYPGSYIAKAGIVDISK